MAATQKGTSLKISFGSFAYTGYLPEDGLTWKVSKGNIEEITDENGDMYTKILMDPRSEFSMTLIVRDSGGSITPPAVGAALTITPPSGASTTCMVRDATMTFARGATRLTLDLVKETSMSYA